MHACTSQITPCQVITKRLISIRVTEFWQNIVPLLFESITALNTVFHNVLCKLVGTIGIAISTRDFVVRVYCSVEVGLAGRVGWCRLCAPMAISILTLHSCSYTADFSGIQLDNILAGIALVTDLVLT